jgi:hypothetical protein
MITNLGQTQQPLEPYNFDPTLRGGLSIRNHLEYGVIQLGVTSQWIRLADRDTLYSGFGGSYRYSYFELFGTLSELEQQLGIAFNDDISGLTGAISYAEQDWNNTPSAASHGVWRWDFGVQF